MKEVSLCTIVLRSLAISWVLQKVSSSRFSEMDIVMRAGDVVQGSMDESDTMCFRDCRCQVRFPRDGSFGTQMIGDVDGDSSPVMEPQYFNLNAGECSTGFEYKLQYDGNFVIYCGSVPTFSTRTHQNPTSDSSRTGGEYVLGIDDNCILHLYYHREEDIVVFVPSSAKDGVDEKSKPQRPSGTRLTTSINEELWTSTRRVLKVGDHLGKGDMVELDGRSNGTEEQPHEESVEYILVLDSLDGNLALYGGSGAAGPPLWAANMEWAAPPSVEMKDYFLQVKKNGHLVLVGIDYVKHSRKIYFDKVLANFRGQSCFTVEYDEDLNDLVAVACEGSVDRTTGNLTRLRGTPMAVRDT